MTAEITPTDRRAALRQALDAADRACHERQEIARALADAPDAASARGFVVALTAAIDAEQAALDALETGFPVPSSPSGADGAKDPPPAKQEPPSGPVLPCRRDGTGYVFRDPGDARVAAEHDLPQWFPETELEAVRLMAKDRTGRTLMPFDPPSKKPRKPRAKKAEGVGPGEPAPGPTPLARYVCEGCGAEGECSPVGPPVPPLCYQCKKAREDADEGNGFLPGFEAATPTAAGEGR